MNNLKNNLLKNKVAFLLLLCFLVTQLWLFDSLVNKKEDALAIERFESLYLKKLPKNINFPEFLIDAKTGEKVEMSTILEGKVKLLNFMNTGCYKCIENLPDWDVYVNEYKDQDSLEFVFIALAPTRKYLKYMLIRQKELHFRVFYDSLNSIGKLNKITEIHATMLLDKNNNVVLGGSPILHKRLMTLYFEKIQNMLAENTEIER